MILYKLYSFFYTTRNFTGASKVNMRPKTTTQLSKTRLYHIEKREGKAMVVGEMLLNVLGIGNAYKLY